MLGIPEQWCWKSLSRVWLFDPMDYTVHGILQARILDWVAFPFSRGSSQPKDWTQVSHVAGGFLTCWATREIQKYWRGWPIPSPGGHPDPQIDPGSPALQADSLPTEPSGKLWYCIERNIRYNRPPSKADIDISLSLKVAQLCSTLCDPMDYTVPAILQDRILE